MSLSKRSRNNSHHRIDHNFPNLKNIFSFISSYHDTDTGGLRFVIAGLESAL